MKLWCRKEESGEWTYGLRYGRWDRRSEPDPEMEYTHANKVEAMRGAMVRIHQRLAVLAARGEWPAGHGPNVVVYGGAK